MGKSTLFNAISRACAEVSNYPFCTKSKNLGVVPVPDERLVKVQAFMKSAKAIPTSVEFVDIAGLVKNAHKGEGLGNQFLSYVREVDAIAHVVRCFPDSNITHVEGNVDPIRDMDIVNTELVLADLTTVEKRWHALKSSVKTGKKEIVKELEAIEKVKTCLEKGQFLRLAQLTDEEKHQISDLHLLTLKPVMYIANVDEIQLKTLEDTPEIQKIKGLVSKENAAFITICAKLEMDIEELSDEEAKEYEKEAGIAEMGLNKVIGGGYKLLDLITFFTANEKECRAWTVRRGAKAPEAAGKVHTDMQKGFISAEIIHYSDLAKAETHAKAREKGLIHLEGRDYIVTDGDLVYIRFNV